MEIKGKVIQVLEPISGKSQKGDWSKQEFILQTSGDYPKSVCIEVWNGKATIPPIGTEITAYINCESREYNNRWYTSIGAWKIELDSATVVDAVNAEIATNEPENLNNKQDSLPF